MERCRNQSLVSSDEDLYHRKCNPCVGFPLGFKECGVVLVQGGYHGASFGPNSEGEVLILTASTVQVEITASFCGVVVKHCEVAASQNECQGKPCLWHLC